MDAVAQRRLGIDELRSGQAEAIEALLDGRDVLAVMATGYGKSAIFQIAAAMVDGLTIVVSPLVALQQDQVESLNSRSRPSAPIGAALNSKISATERDEIWESVEAGTLDILYLAPEQLTRDDVRTRLAAVGVALVAVDEAHCVSSWGHEFRPDYLRVGEAVAALSAPPIIALTATASPPVRDDIVDKLHMRDPVRITGGFDRPEIRLEVRMHPDGAAASDAAVEDVCAQKGQGLVYTDTKAGAEELARRLSSAGTSARPYHGGMTRRAQEAVADDFSGGRIDVVVATSAFGMGIDKPDIRFVVHAAAPGSVDAYYQEAGRAGRDGQPALARLHYQPNGSSLHNFFATRKLDESMARRILDTLRSIGRATPLRRLHERVDARPRRVSMTTNVLKEAGVVVESSGGVKSALDSSGRKPVEDAIAQAKHVSEREQKHAQSRVDMMRSYAESTRCRRRFLLEYFGQDYDRACGNCDVCTERPTEEAVSTGRFSLNDDVTHRQWGRGTVSAVESDRVTVLFEEEGYKTLSLELVDDKLEPTDSKEND